MAINLATKFQKKVSERFAAESKTKLLTNDDYDWVGSNAIKIYSVDTVAMGNYTRSGASRYGSPSELGTTLQTWTLARDRAFTTTIDRRNNDESMGVTEAGKFLARQVKEVITPEIDTYVLAAIGTAAATANRDDIATDAATTAANAYVDFLAINADISDNEVPEDGRVAVMTAQYYNFLKQSGFVLASDTAYGDLKKGSLGTVDGVKVVICPSSRMPANTNLIITHPVATTAPMLLTDYVTHKNAPGINGWLVEGRVVYDAFVDTNKTDALGVHKTA